jgi:hypothetical protein
VGFVDTVFGGRSLEALLERARKRLAAGKFDEALKAVEVGLAKYPGAAALRETGHAVRRAQARAGMQGLKERIERDGDPAAFDELIALYREFGMADEATRLADEYAQEHPELEAPHVLRGEAALNAFFSDLRLRDGRQALERLLKAGQVKPDSVKPRLLLAELYFTIGADRALLGQVAAIGRLAKDDEIVQPLLQALREQAKPAAAENVDALLSKVEVTGALARDPAAWPGGSRRGGASERDAQRTASGLERLVKRGDALEAVAIDRSGEVVSRAPAVEEDATEGAATLLSGVARSVARTVKSQAQELDLGSFRRCVVEGPFGVLLVGDAGGTLVAARGTKGAEPDRLWERMALAVDAGGRGRRS